MFSAAAVSQSVIEVPVTVAQLDRAMERYERHDADLHRRGKKHLNNSIEEGRGSFVGMLGEEITYDFFPGGETIWERTPEDHPYDYDLRLLVMPHMTVDVKTKNQTYDKAPRPHYFATVCDKNTTQQCDLYWFVRVHCSFEKAWILGCLPKLRFFQTAQFNTKGEPDPTSHCGWCFKEDCWNLPINKLWLPKTLGELQAMVLHTSAVDDLAPPL